MTHLVVLGAGGQVGQAVVALARSRAIPCRGLGRVECDISDRLAVERAVEGSRFVVNCAAYTAVDKAETEVELAHQVNAIGAGNIAAACARTGVPLLHMSTDYVFDGEGARPAQEDDAPHPLNVYGRSKLAGEIAVREHLHNHIILRTSWVFSASGQNFVKTMLRVAQTKSEIRVVHDQIGGPTAAQDIAKAILTIAEMSARPDFAHWGTYHFSGAPALSWFEFAQAILRDLDVAVLPIATQDYPTPARRPRNSVLDCSRIGGVFGIAPPDWRAGLRQVCAALADQ